MSGVTMNEIKNLCHTYQQHLSTSDNGEPLSAMKKKIVTEILEKNNPQDILSLLSRQTSDLKLIGHPKYSSYEQILRMRRSSWLRDIVMGLLLVLTFPISVPFLMIWSRTTRGDINFSKPDGAVFVEKLQFLCEQASPQAQIELSSIKNLNNLTLLRNNPVNDYRSLVPQVNLKPRRTALTASTKERGGFFGGLFDSSSHLSDSGDPQLLSFRMRPFAYHQDNFISVDIFCNFKFIPNLMKGTSLKLRFDLRPSYLSAQSISSPSLSLETQEASETVTQQTDVLQTIQNYFFKPKPPETFETIYAAIQEQRCDVRDGSLLALKLARNDTQRVMALECLINTLKRRYDFYCEKAEEEEVEVKKATTRLKLLKDYEEGRYVPGNEWEKADIERWTEENEVHLRHHHLPLWEETLYRAEYRAQQNINASEQCLQELSDALDSLPANYRSITPSANQLQATFDLMFRLLENNQIGDAEILYQKNKNLSYFLETAFPHFKALLKQFTGTFFLVSQLGAYSMLAYNSEPTDRQIKKNRLIVYCKDNRIWVAARHPDDQIHRFVIDRNRLGNKTAKTVYEEFERRRRTNMLKPILADYGYHDIFWPHIINARTWFLEAHQCIQSYDAALAERFERETLRPLQALIDFGVKARERTPVDIQLQMIDIHCDECRKLRLSGEVSTQPSILSDAAWDELLVDSIETLQQEETTYNQFGVRV